MFNLLIFHNKIIWKITGRFEVNHLDQIKNQQNSS